MGKLSKILSELVNLSGNLISTKIHSELGGHLLRLLFDNNPSAESKVSGIISYVIWKVTQLKVRISTIQ